jgi:hypothetical protein
MLMTLKQLLTLVTLMTLVTLVTLMRFVTVFVIYISSVSSGEFKAIVGLFCVKKIFLYMAYALLMSQSCFFFFFSAWKCWPLALNANRSQGLPVRF